MSEFYRFLRLIQTTRSMPQTGYVISGIKKAELSDLAQHHYLVTAIGWYLANLLKKNKGRVNIERVLEICLIHDLGELFGGDIAMPYAKANPVASKVAKQFEQENQSYLTKFLPNAKQAFELFKEANHPKSDEAILAKIADYIEVTEYQSPRAKARGLIKGMIVRFLCFHPWAEAQGFLAKSNKRYLNRLTDGDVSMVLKRIRQMIEAVKHKRTAECLTNIVENWAENILADSGGELFEEAKKL